MNTHPLSTQPLRSLKIVVIGGTGLIGSKVVAKLRTAGHEVVPASPSTGVNLLAGDGLTQALNGAQVVVDVSNAPSFEDQAVMDFFATSSRNLAAAENAADVQHHVALSVVGTDRLQDSGYFRAKLVQENAIRVSGIPFTLVRATQFYEFTGAIAYGATVAQEVRAPSALMQPVAAEDVATVVAEAAQAKPLNGITEVAGPELIPMDDLLRQYLAAQGDERQVITDETARYFGLAVDDNSLTPGPAPVLGKITFAGWLQADAAQK